MLTVDEEFTRIVTGKMRPFEEPDPSRPASEEGPEVESSPGEEQPEQEK